MRNARRKQRAIQILGGKCACCGETELAFLQIDHVNNDGAEHRREIGSGNIANQMYYEIIRGTCQYELQVLCANCNQAKKLLGVCPHQR